MAVSERLWQRSDVQDGTEPMPAFDVVHVSSVQVVELEDHRSLEVVVGYSPLFITLIPAKIITHPVEFFYDWPLLAIVEVGVSCKE